MYSPVPVSLAAQTRRYFVGQTVIGAGIVNAIINGAIGWLAVLKLPALPMWGTPSVFIDTVLTAFGVAFGSAIVVTFQARKDMYLGKVSPSVPTGWLGSVVDALPLSLIPRAFVLGAACVVLFVPAPMWWLAQTGLTELLPWPFIAFKAGFSAVVGAAVTPLISLHAMVSARGRSI